MFALLEVGIVVLIFVGFAFKADVEIGIAFEKKSNYPFDNVKEIEEDAFAGINSKAKIVIKGTEEQYNELKKLIEASGIGSKMTIVRK